MNSLKISRLAKRMNLIYIFATQKKLQKKFYLKDDESRNCI